MANDICWDVHATLPAMTHTMTFDTVITAERQNMDRNIKICTDARAEIIEADNGYFVEYRWGDDDGVEFRKVSAFSKLAAAIEDVGEFFDNDEWE